MTPADFYYASLAQNKIAIARPDLTKVAEARGVTLELAEKARAVYDQLTLDGVKFASAKAQLDDAFKIAYAAHQLGADLPRFYDDTLALHGHPVEREDLSKVASAHGGYTATLAKLYYDQLSLDGMPNPEDRAGVAMKMAEAYVKQAKENDEKIAAFASRVHDELVKAAEAFCKTAGAELSGEEAVKLATELNPLMRQHTGSFSAGPIADMTDVSQLTQGAPAGGQPMASGAQNAEIAALNSNAPVTAAAPAVAAEAPGVAANARSLASRAGGFLSKHRWPIGVGAGLAGLGGLYMLNHAGEQN